ncbi:MAG: xanthine dehydrogenase family protein subunit M [Gemmatimonadetes bacterium]|nr:xanthine dehydrogenase family protein subunit M [Gemmatimonadota bacterium]
MFTVAAPTTLAELAGAAAGGAAPLGGGTDLLVALESGIGRASGLAATSHIAEMGAVELGDHVARLGAAVRLDDLARHSLIVDRYRLLADAAAAVGTPALREMGTLGGNLAQRPRCWYLRSRIPCLKNGGAGCPATEGENQYHAILGAGPCHAAHPSDLAVALVALDATLVTFGPNGERSRPLDSAFANAASDPHAELSLDRGEVIVRVEIPPAAAGGAQQFTKLMQRAAWDFATVSLAAARRVDGSVRLVLGGVAPGPWRVNASVEEDVASGALDADSADALADRALHDARPLSKNGYKLQQAAALLSRAMLTLSQG